MVLIGKELILQAHSFVGVLAVQQFLDQQTVLDVNRCLIRIGFPDKWCSVISGINIRKRKINHLKLPIRTFAKEFFFLWLHDDILLLIVDTHFSLVVFPVVNHILYLSFNQFRVLIPWMFISIDNAPFFFILNVCFVYPVFEPVNFSVNADLFQTSGSVALLQLMVCG